MTLLILDAGACTDVGRQRQSNEDALLLSDPVFAVADGMGGARAGEVASAMAVAALHDFRGDEQVLVDAIKQVNARIHATAQADASLLGMGTTITAAMIDADALVVAHVGDSRAYLLRARRLQQITSDHSLVGELIRRGALTPAEAERHPQRSVITRALGAESAVEVDVLRISAEAEDVILLCSDGLTGMVSDVELERIINNGGTMEQVAQRLITAANGAGGEDNITAVLMHLGTRGDEDTEPERPPIVILPITALETIGGEGSGDPRVTAQVRPRRNPGMLAIGVAVTLGIALAVLIAGGLQWAHFVGATPDGRVAIYQGLPIAVTTDLRLYRPVRITDLPTAVLSADERQSLLDQRLGSEADAQGRIDALLATAPWLRPPPSVS